VRSAEGDSGTAPAGPPPPAPVPPALLLAAPGRQDEDRAALAAATRPCRLC